MIYDINDLQDHEEHHYDIVVVGTGPAGITVALQFLDQHPVSGKGIRVALLESSPKSGASVQFLYEGKNACLLANRSTWPTNYLVQGRLRQYGGTSNHWGGWSWPLEPYDMEANAVRPQSWPISHQELLPFYLEAQRPVMQLDAFAYDNIDYWIDNTPEFPLEAMPLPDDSPLRTRVLQFHGIHFEDQYGSQIENSVFVDLYRNANALELKTADTPAGRQVTALKAQSLEGGQPGTVTLFQADNFVVASGGIEAARFLLLNDIGNSSGHLGRNFMDHPYQNGARYQIETIPEKIRNFYLGIEGVQSNLLTSSLKPIPAPNGKSTFIAGLVPRHEWLEKMGVANFRILLGGISNQPGTIMTNIEPLPRAGGFITLTGEQDVFGQNQVEVCWQVSDLARPTGEAMFEAVRETLSSLGYGSGFQFPTLDPRAWGPGLHPMGATRMAACAENGVVDRNLRVFDSTNLYVASSSVFPTAGYQNPTFTICALAIRLARHLGATP